MKPTAFLRRFLAIAGSAVLAAPLSNATDYYWNQNGTTAGWGVGGAWDTTTAVFTATTEDPLLAAAAATTTTADTLYIGTATTGFAGGTLTLSGTQNIGSIITGSANTTAGIGIVGGTLNFAASGTITNNSSQALTIDSVIGVAGATTRLDLNANGGDIIISGSANTYTGITYVNSGTVISNNAASLGASGTDANRTVVASGARISFNNTPRTYTERFEIAGAGVGGTTGALTNFQTATNLNGLVSLSGAATIYNSAGTLTIGSAAATGGISLGSNALTFNAAGGIITVGNTGITGTGSIIKAGAGTLNLNVSSSYSGSTTINGGTLNAVSTAALGDSSATNTLIFNGGTLQAGGTITSAATRGVTLTSTGIIDTNSQAVSIAGNATGAGGLTKNGAGTLTLSGTNNYSGVTTVNAGTLAIAKDVSLASNTAANVNVKAGATLALNVDGSGGFTTANLSTLLTNVFVANTAVQGLQSGAILGLDTTSAGGSFTHSGAIADSTGAFGGMIHLNKLGTGTLVLDQANTYTGTTLITAGTLNFGSSANQSLSGMIGGAGALTKSGAGTLTLSASNIFSGTTTVSAGILSLTNSLALQNSALDTTNSIAGDASNGLRTTQTALTIGGLTGNKNFAATGGVFTTASGGYGSVGALTLNPSVTQTYTGVIENGASGMTLTKTGAGTQILQGANSYSGATNINVGTLTLSGAAGALASTTINLNGGGLTLDNTTNSGTRVSDSATINVNASSALTFSHGGAAATDYTETIDTLSLQSGFLTYTGSQANATGPRTSNLLFNTLSRSGTATVNFAGTGLGVDARNTIKFGAGVTSGQDLGPWAVVNGAGFATYDSTLGIKAATTSVLAAGSNSSTTNFDTTGGSITLTAALNPSYKTLLVTGGTARTTAINGNTVSVGGISSTGATHVISGLGAVQALNAGDPLYINVGANALTFSSVIQNVGAGATASTLVKSGTGTLTLGGTNTYSGGTVLNAGALTTAADSNLGASIGGITVNGPVTWTYGAVGYARSITINQGAVLGMTGTSGMNFSGMLSGSGTLSNVGSSIGFTFSNANNTFTGAVNAAYALTFASLGDSSNPYNMGAANNGFTWTGGAKTFALRPFTLNAAGGGQINSSGTGALVIQQPLGFAGAAGARSLTLGGTYTGGTNQFAGNIADGPGSVVSLIRSADAGTWALSGTNTYSGATTLTVGGGEFGFLTFQGMQALSPNTSLNQNQGALNTRANTIKFLDDSATPASRSGVNLNFSNIENVTNTDNRFHIRAFIGNNSIANGGTSSSTQTGSTIQLGNLNLSQGAAASTGGGLQLTGANGYRLQIANVNVTLLAGTTTNWNAQLNPITVPMTVTGNVQQAAGAGAGATTTLQLDGTATGNLISGNLLNSADGSPKNLLVSKSNSSTWTLSGSNTYSGGTSITGGKLIYSGANALPSTGTVAVGAAGHLSLADGTARSNTVSALTLTSLANLSFDWTGNNTGDQLTSTADITPTAGSHIAINLNRSGTPGGSVTLLTGGGSSTLSSSNFYLANATDYTATLSKTATTVSVGSYSSATELTTMYWSGNKLAAAATANIDNAWALSDGTKSNWSSTTTGYTATALTPGATTNVIFANGQVGKTQQTTTLGADVTVNSIVIDDSVAVTIAGTSNAALTLMSSLSTAGTVGGTPGSAITVTSNAANPTISSRVYLGANQTWNVANTKTLTVTGVVDGAYSLTKGGAGTVILSGANTYTGDTTISGGILSIGNNSAGTLGNGNYAGNIINNGALQIWSTSAQTLSGVISGSGTLNKSYGGTLTLAGANTYTGRSTFVPKNTGGFTVNVSSFNSWNNGTPLLASSSLGAPTTEANATIDVGGTAQAGVTLNYTGSGETTDRILNVAWNGNSSQTISASGTGPLKFTSQATLATSGGTGSLVLTGTGIGEFSQGFSTNMNTSGLSKTGTGTWILSGASTYNRPTVITGGTLIARSATALGTGASTNVSVATNTGLTYNAASDVALSIGGTLAITGGASTVIGGSIGSTTTSAQISSAGNATATAANITVNIYGNTFSTATSGTNTYTLVKGNGGANTLNVASSLTLGTVFNNTNFTVGALSKTASTIDVAITQVSALTGGTYYVGGLGNTANVWAASNGTTRSNFSTSSGGTAQALVPGSTADVIVDSNSFATSTVLGADMSVNSLTISDNTSNFALNADGYGLTIGSGGITKSNTTTRTATIASNLVLGAGQTWSNSDTGNALVVSGIVTGANNLEVGGAGNTTVSGRLMTGAGTLTKTGAGTLTLTSSNTYTGATTVTNGVLAVNGSLANTATTVQSGGTLQGSGTIGGSVTIQSGGTLATGNSIESLATGALSLEALSTLTYEMNKDAAANESGDLTAVTGNLTIALTSDANLSLVELGAGTWTVGEKLTLISYTGTWNGGLLKILGGSIINDDSTITYSNVNWLFNYNDTAEGDNYTADSNGTYVTMTAMAIVPEPGAALIGSLGLLALLRRRRN